MLEPLCVRGAWLLQLLTTGSLCAHSCAQMNTSGRVYTRRVRLADESPTCNKMTAACVSLLLRNDSSCDAVPVVGFVLGFVHLSRGRHPETL